MAEEQLFKVKKFYPNNKENDLIIVENAIIIEVGITKYTIMLTGEGRLSINKVDIKDASLKVLPKASNAIEIF